MENISLENIHLTFGGGGTAEEADRRDLPQIAGEYFMMGPMPAYGLCARNVHGLTLENIRFQVSTPDLRPALIFDHVEDAAIRWRRPVKDCLGHRMQEGCQRNIRESTGLTKEKNG
jgi:hypothetical protein